MVNIFMCRTKLENYFENLIYEIQEIRKELCVYTYILYKHWVPLSYGLVPHLSKKLSKFPYILYKARLFICHCSYDLVVSDWLI